MVGASDLKEECGERDDDVDDKRGGMIHFPSVVLSVTPVEFFIPDQQPTSPLVKVKVGHDGIPTESPQLSAIVKRFVCVCVCVCLQPPKKGH